jgi:hypothetical protein
MRNYLALNLVQAFFGVPPDLFRFLVWGTSVQDVFVNLAWLETQVGQPLDHVDDQGIQYVLLDKSNVAQMMTVLGSPNPYSIIGVRPSWYPRGGSGENYDQSRTFEPQPASPVRGWQDVTGVQKDPSPSDAKGKPSGGRGTSPFAQLFQVIANLANSFPHLRDKLLGLLNDIQNGITDYAQALSALSFIMKGA